jgi:hypothetical protein
MTGDKHYIKTHHNPNIVLDAISMVGVCGCADPYNTQQLAHLRYRASLLTVLSL